VSAVVIKQCSCGKAVECEEVEGPLADLANKWGVLCGECEAKQERNREAARQRAAAQQELAHREAQKQRIEEAIRTLPAGLRGFNLGDLDRPGREKAIEAAERWALGQLQGLILLGGVGVGKTTLAAAATVTRITWFPNNPPRWMGVTQALGHLSRAFGDPTREDTLKALTTSSAPLILDDLDKAKPSAFAAETLFTAIDGCFAHARPLMASMNVTPGEIARRWPAPHGEAIASRLAACEVYRVSGPDRRQAKAA
jgi:DNA replication protein DnaC